MSKKNRHKSRQPHRAPAPAKPQAAAAPAVADADADAMSRDAYPGHGADAGTAEAAQASTEHAAGVQPDSTQSIDTGEPDDDVRNADLRDDALGMLGAPVSTQPASDTATAASAPLAFAPPTPAPMASAGDIRGVLIQVAGARLLLPNATIAEVLSYADPEPVGESAPAWLLGRLRWRGWQVPLVAFGTLAGVAQERAALGSKVVVLKALAGTSRTPYFAMLTQGFPRLVTVSRQALSVEDDTADAMPRAVQARVRLNDDPALLPDLEAIEALVADAVAHAA